ncbi:MAG TPA: cysteine--tRNA ligase [Bacteroidota bacterium]|nr:cysteine--tRNA ligase [Bacteroidota bacterium]
MALTIYNTLSRSKEEFTPLHEGRVGMYVCGPTVYSDSHIGHGKSYVSFDVIVRYLRYLGYKVLYVQNITDVGHLLDDGEDRMLKQSRIDKIHPMQIAEKITRSYFDDMDALNVLRPDISPRATGHIIEQTEIVKELLTKGYAYEVNGSVYFDVRKFKNYGKLSGRSVDEMKEGTRVEVKSEKRNPEDFALWKKAEPEHIMRWPSPWGDGFPGWHIECSAMSMKYLGETFDIHGGGLDNQFPHHECEIAQSESATGKHFVKYWVHNNLVTVNGQKMSKSLGNFVTLKDEFKKFDPIVVRFFILQSHYRSTLDFSEQAMEASKVGLSKLNNSVRKLREMNDFAKRASSFGMFERDLTPLRNGFLEAMNDDFNTPKGIAILFELVSIVNEWLAPGMLPNEATLHEALSLFDDFGSRILGIIPTETVATDAGDAATEKGLMELILGLRKRARAESQWQTADAIRKGLEQLNIKIEDSKDGTTTWKKA